MHAYVSVIIASLQFCEEKFELRNLDDHKHCDDVEGDRSLSTEWGVNRRSVLMELQYFNVCECLLPDVMHDLLEGALQYEAKLLLQRCVGEGYLQNSEPPDMCV